MPQVLRQAVKRLNAAIEQCRAVGDNGTRELLEHILHEEEEHVDWAETQLEEAEIFLHPEDLDRSAA